MKAVRYGLVLSLAIVSAAAADAQAQSAYPVADEVANKVIAKYENSSCQELAAAKQQPPSAEKNAVKQKAMQQLRQDPQMRQYFINKIAAPIANKLFECGMIP
jgi:hypothetical protein